jgi:hypothetical protein
MEWLSLDLNRFGFSSVKDFRVFLGIGSGFVGIGSLKLDGLVLQGIGFT